MSKRLTAEEITPFTIEWWMNKYLEAYLLLDDLDTYGEEWGLDDYQIRTKMMKCGEVMRFCRKRVELKQESRLQAIVEEVEGLKRDTCNFCGEGFIWKDCGCHNDGRNELADEVLQIIQQHLQDNLD